LVALPARATYGARTTADEPQYLLSALSLAEDGDLWVDDELAADRFRPFHELDLPVQTEPRPNGREVSPHDPLLPVILAVPTGVGGWAAAKATLAVIAGLLAGLLTWVAHRRFAVGLGVASTTVLAFGCTAPLTAYATQVYPELPAALAVLVAVAALTAWSQSRRTVLVWGLAVTALPWLGVKYVPVAAALVLVGLVSLGRGGRWRLAGELVGGMALAGVAYLVAHRLIYGGWTVYAAGDHFVDGEMGVVGDDPNYWARSRRLVGLLLDRSFGLAAWMPGYLLLVPAGWVLLKRRPTSWLVVVAPLLAGWATATWVALTMHGWWWPGRQTVVVLPCAVLVIAWWVDRVRPARLALAATAVVGVWSWLWLVREVRLGDRALIVDFYESADPVYGVWRAVLPDYWHPGTGDWVLQGVWLVVLGVVAVVAGRADGPTRVEGSRKISSTEIRRPTHVSA
jgi:hypothetical protein